MKTVPWVVFGLKIYDPVYFCVVPGLASDWHGTVE